MFLPVRNAADWVTARLIDLSERSLFYYFLLTATIAAVTVVFFLVTGQKRALRWQRFAMIAAEGVIYAVAMRLAAGYVVGQLRLSGSAVVGNSGFTGLVMSLGAGFYEELVFRVGLFALAGHLVSLVAITSPSTWKRGLFWVVWAVVCGAVFSGWHHVGDLGEPFALDAFVFRWVSGVIFTAIFALRGFATAVWTHALYDIWVMVL